MSSERLKGRLTYYSADRAFGFVEPHGCHAPVFVHISQVRGHSRKSRKILAKGDLIEFRIAEGDRGLYAADVAILELAPFEKTEEYRT